MIINTYKSYRNDGSFDREAHHKMLLVEIYNACEKIFDAHEHIVHQKTMAEPHSTVDDHGANIIRSFFDFEPVLLKVKKEIETELEIHPVD